MATLLDSDRLIFCLALYFPISSLIKQCLFYACLCTNPYRSHHHRIVQNRSQTPYVIIFKHSRTRVFKGDKEYKIDLSFEVTSSTWRNDRLERVSKLVKQEAVGHLSEGRLELLFWFCWREKPFWTMHQSGSCWPQWYEWFSVGPLINSTPLRTSVSKLPSTLTLANDARTLIFRPTCLNRRCS